MHEDLISIKDLDNEDMDPLMHFDRVARLARELFVNNSALTADRCFEESEKFYKVFDERRRKTPKG